MAAYIEALSHSPLTPKIVTEYRVAESTENGVRYGSWQRAGRPGSSLEYPRDGHHWIEARVIDA